MAVSGLKYLDQILYSLSKLKFSADRLILILDKCIAFIFTYFKPINELCVDEGVFFFFFFFVISSYDMILNDFQKTGFSQSQSRKKVILMQLKLTLFFVKVVEIMKLSLFF